MTAALSTGDLVVLFGASTVPAYERAMPPRFIVQRPRGLTPAQADPDADDPPSSDAEAAPRTHSGITASRVPHGASAAPSMAPADEAAIARAMLRYAQGDNAAFRDVYTQLAPRLHGFCVRLCAVSAEADDLLQETLLKLHRSRAAYRPDTNPLHWAFAIARCAYIDRLRRKKVRPEVLGSGSSALEKKADGSEPEAELQAVQLRAIVQTVLLAQPEAARTSYILVRLEGVSVADAAAILSASTDAIKQRVHRVALALREQLERRGLDVHP
jgi:RNA polymerase sigma-70 factor, ECF subfamily